VTIGEADCEDSDKDVVVAVVGRVEVGARTDAVVVDEAPVVVAGCGVVRCEPLLQAESRASANVNVTIRTLLTRLCSSIPAVCHRARRKETSYIREIARQIVQV
jgi:hypothetical protein